MHPQRPRGFSAGSLLSIGSFLALLAALAMGFAGPGCREQASAPIDRNLAPETDLIGVPGDSTTNFYRIQLFWNGFDPDGKVVGFEWAITDSLPPAADAIPWKYTTATDSTFTFTVEENREVLGHRFYVRAVDNEGKRDPNPSFTFFTVRNNCIPVAHFTQAYAFGPNGERKEITSTNTTAPGDTVPSGWGVNFAWIGSDCDRAYTQDGQLIQVGHVVGYDRKLTPLEFEWDRGTVNDTTVTFPASSLHSALYEMRARARDDAGLTGLDPALRTFVWNLDPKTYFTKDLVPGHPDSVEVFYASTGGLTAPFLPYADGDTIPLTAAGPRIRGVVRAIDPDPPYQITLVQARLVKDSAFWTPLGPDLTIQVDLSQAVAQFTGDYQLMASSIDGLARPDGTPALIHFSVNKKVRFISSWTYYSTDYTQSPKDGDVLPVPHDPARLSIQFAAYDPDPPEIVAYGVEFQYRFDVYPLPNGQSAGEPFYRSGQRLGDNDGTSPAWVLLGAVVLPNSNTFIPGTYVLHYQAREHYTSDSNRERYGFVWSDRLVSFQIQ